MIVTSFVFRDGKLEEERLAELVRAAWRAACDNLRARWLCCSSRGEGRGMPRACVWGAASRRGWPCRLRSCRPICACPGPCAPRPCAPGQAGWQAAAGSGPQLPQEGRWQVLCCDRPLAEVLLPGPQVKGRAEGLCEGCQGAWRAAGTRRRVHPQANCCPARLSLCCRCALASLLALAGLTRGAAALPRCAPPAPAAARPRWHTLQSRATSFWCTAWMWRACRRARGVVAAGCAGLEGMAGELWGALLVPILPSGRMPRPILEQQGCAWCACLATPPPSEQRCGAALRVAAGH